MVESAIVETELALR